jgi:FKBP-type peptidyl-prolyl cis-trans isomerase
MVRPDRAAPIVVLGLAAAAVLVACTDPLTGPSCTPMPWTVASTSADTTTTNRGLRFINNDSGVFGSLDWCGSVRVHYDGYLLDGTLFDSSRPLDRSIVFSPGVGSLIDGFEQGVIGMRTCGTRRLIIPPELGYGNLPVQNDSGDVIVPPNSTVVFDVQVIEILNQPFVVCDTLAP